MNGEGAQRSGYLLERAILSFYYNDRRVRSN